MEDKKKDDIKTREEELDLDIENVKEKFGIDENLDTKEEEIDDIARREREIELRLQEIDVEMDKIEIKLSIDEDDRQAADKYNLLRQETKELLKEKKTLRKIVVKENINPEVKSLDNLSVWIIVYGIFASLFSSPLLSSVWVKFAQLIIEVSEDTIGAMDPTTVLGKIVVILLVFAFPLLLHIVSWVLYLNLVKSKTDKFAFKVAWISQALFTIITMVIALINVFKK